MLTAMRVVRINDFSQLDDPSKDCNRRALYLRKPLHPSCNSGAVRRWHTENTEHCTFVYEQRAVDSLCVGKSPVGRNSAIGALKQGNPKREGEPE